MSSTGKRVLITVLVSFAVWFALSPWAVSQLNE